MKKIALLLTTLMLISACGRNSQNSPTQSPEPTPAAETDLTSELEYSPDQIFPSTQSSANNLTQVSSVDYPMFSEDSMETITLYTSAQKSNGRFHWDDHAQWVLEISSDSGDYYTLYDTDISNGSLYFDLIGVDDSLYVLVKNVSTAANYTRIFKIADGKVFETNDLDLNNMNNININMIYTSIPQYR